MSLKIKVCGMKYGPNIASVSRLEPDYMGFIFYPPSKRFVGVDFQKGDIAGIPKQIKKVAVYVNAQFQEVEDFSRIYGISYVQLHGDESPEFCQQLRDKGFKVIKAFGVDDTFDFEKLYEYKDHVNYFLFDTKTSSYGGSGKSFNWDILKNYELAVPYFLSGGLDADNLKNIDSQLFPGLHAVDLNSKFESEPAVKNYDLLSEVFNYIRQ